MRSKKMAFILGFLIGSIVSYLISYVLYRKAIKRAVADAETQGIQKGAILESELGWSKKTK
jgi:hypothetical protein